MKNIIYGWISVVFSFLLSFSLFISLPKELKYLSSLPPFAILNTFLLPLIIFLVLFSVGLYFIFKNKTRIADTDGLLVLQFKSLGVLFFAYISMFSTLAIFQTLAYMYENYNNTTVFVLFFILVLICSYSIISLLFSVIALFLKIKSTAYIKVLKTLSIVPIAITVFYSVAYFFD